MKKLLCTVRDPLGLHARPATLLMKKCQSYQSQIQIDYNGKNADAKRMMSILALSIKPKSEIEITINGSDEDDAYDSIKEFAEENI